MGRHCKGTMYVGGRNGIRHRRLGRTSFPLRCTCRGCPAAVRISPCLRVCWDSLSVAHAVILQLPRSYPVPGIPFPLPASADVQVSAVAMQIL